MGGGGGTFYVPLLEVLKSIRFSPVDTAFVRAMYKKGLGTINREKRRNRTLFQYRNFSQAIIVPDHPSYNIFTEV